MRMTVARLINFFTLSFLLIILFDVSSALAVEAKKESQRYVEVGRGESDYRALAIEPEEGSYIVPLPAEGRYYPDCSTRSYPCRSRDRWCDGYEVCYRWIPGHYKYYSKWQPGYWKNEPVWYPGYWKKHKKWVPGRWETKHYGGYYRDCYKNYGYYGRPCYGDYYYGDYPYRDYYRDASYYANYDSKYYDSQDYRETGMPPTAPDTQAGTPYGYFDSSGVWVPYQQ